MLDEMAALLVRLTRDVLGAGVCLPAAHVALNHKTSLGGHLKVSPFKEPTILAVAGHNKGVKLEALPPPSPNNTPDLPGPALLSPPNSFLSQPLSTTTRLLDF